MLAAIVLWLATAVFVCATELDDAQGAYEIGRALGAATSGLLWGAVLRLIYVRLTPWGRGKPQTAPAFFLLAAALTVPAILGLELGDDDPVDRYVSAADECSGGDESPLATAGGFEVVPFDSARRARWEHRSQGLAPDELLARMQPFEVEADGRLVALGQSVPGLDERDQESFLSGAIDDAALDRAAITPLTVDGERGYLVRSPRVSLVVTYQGCWGVALYARDRATVTRAAQSIAAG